jgi:hypothetical protein
MRLKQQTNERETMLAGRRYREREVRSNSWGVGTKQPQTSKGEYSRIGDRNISISGRLKTSKALEALDRGANSA